MNDIQIYDIRMLHLLWLAAGAVLIMLYGAAKRKARLEKFAGRSRWQTLFARQPSRQRRFWKSLCLLGALLFVILALARPAWNLKKTEVRKQGRDVVFLLDVSRSMLAEDLAPNRLERAKIAIRDAVEKLRGDRVALVVFAGRAVIKCPLTIDYGFFRQMLDDVSVQSVNRGGTLIGDAIRAVLDTVFDSQARQYKDIVLITDGEDHESFPVEAARGAGEIGVRLIIVGLGDESEGRRIPVTDESGRRTFLKYRGREIWTRLDGATLRQMAAQTPSGTYLPVATGNIDLGRVYMDLIAGAEKRALDTQVIHRYQEKFQIFLALGFILLCIDMLVSDTGRKSGNESTL